jgi:hypothetical protein
MSVEGVFAVHRGIWEHPRFKRERFTEREAWMWLVSEAAYKPRRVRIGSAVVHLERGQLAHSLRFMARAWHWKEPRVRRFLTRLKIDASIDAAIDAGQTVITICNYDAYQFPGARADAANDAPDDAPATQQRRKLEEGKKEISINPPSQTPSADAAPAPAKRIRSLTKRAYTPEFETFWTGYPKTKTTNPKTEAFDVWQRLAPEDQAAAIASLPAYAAHCRQQFEGYQPPGAGVYLRKRRFDDHQPNANASAADPAKIRAGQLAKARAHFNGEWRETWGPRPGDADCTIPADVIAEARNESGTLQ